MGLSTMDVVDAGFHVINLDQEQKSESVLINFLVLFLLCKLLSFSGT